MGTELVHETIRTLQTERHSQIVVSHGVEDLIDLVDRIAVMYRGEIAAILDPATADRELLTEIMTSGRDPTA